MHLIDDRLILTPSNLTAHLACPHLTVLEQAAARGELTRPDGEDPQVEVLRRRGDEHEQRHLQSLREAGLEVVEVARPGATMAELVAAEEATVAAMASGADVVYQGTFFDGRWRGHPDFLIRVDRPSGRWAWSYEVVDTKLARAVRGSAILQVCAYSEQLARVQGSAPDQLHVVGGDMVSHSYRLAEFEAYYRRTKATLEQAVGRIDPTYPDPVAHCAVCPWAPRCDEQRRGDDHLSLVAGMRRAQAAKLTAAGFGTVEGLAAAPADLAVPRMNPAVLGRLHQQARLQVSQRPSGEVTFELVDPEAGQGLSLLPAPSPGDLFFDIEGDPFVGDGGLEYLFGLVDLDGGAARYHSFWAHDPAGEKAAFEALVDFIIGRLDHDPGLHVFHYAAYEPSALKRLMGRFGTRESEVDRLLRGGVFCDLYQVVRQGVRVSQESYSLKALEPLYMEKRGGAITTAGSSVVAYEEWLATGEQRILDEIRDYNQVDCESTWRLRDWLEARRSDLDTAAGEPLTRPAARDAAPSDDQARVEADTAALVARLVAGIPDDPAERTAEQGATWLLAQLLGWHRREARPEWWAYFARLTMSDEELLDDREAIGGLAYEGPVEDIARSVVHRYRFPADQEHKIGVGDQVIDPRTNRAAGTVFRLDSATGLLDLKRGRGSTIPHPGAVTPEPPVNSVPLQRAVYRVGQWVADHGVDAPGPYRAVRDLLLQLPPRIPGHPAGAPLSHPGEAPLAAARRLVTALGSGCLPIQGPPGTGKTYSGARMIVDRVAAGRRVGITANSHKAIGNLLDQVVAAAAEAGVELRALQRASENDRCSSDAVDRAPDNATVFDRLAAGDVDVVAGTQWLFAQEQMAGAVDVLFVDEAGQMSLANVVALGAATDGLVLLGDPQQLAQPSQGTHPPGPGVSALEHLLAGQATIPSDRGLLLDVTWRLHPAVCRFISDSFYEGRLTADRRLRPADRRPRAVGRRGRPPLDPRRPRGQPGDVTGGGRRGGCRCRCSARPALGRPDRPGPHPHPRRHPRRRPLQRPGRPAPGGTPPWRPGGHGRQVPGPGGRRGHLRHGHLLRRRPAPRSGVPVQPQPAERGALPGPDPGRGHRQPPASRHPLPHTTTDAPREHPLSPRRIGHRTRRFGTDRGSGLAGGDRRTGLPVA